MSDQQMTHFYLPYPPWARLANQEAGSLDFNFKRSYVLDSYWEKLRYLFPILLCYWLRKNIFLESYDNRQVNKVPKTNKTIRRVNFFCPFLGTKIQHHQVTHIHTTLMAWLALRLRLMYWQEKEKSCALIYWMTAEKGNIQKRLSVARVYIVVVRCRSITRVFLTIRNFSSLKINIQTLC